MLIPDLTSCGGYARGDDVAHCHRDDALTLGEILKPVKSSMRSITNPVAEKVG